MTALADRRRFLRGDFSGRARAFRPPWAVDEACFVDRCSRCRECISVCPEKVILQGDAGFPIVDFSLGECSFCGECADRCKDRALLREVVSPPWLLKASIAENCLAFQGVVCANCKEQCESAAITMKYVSGPVAIPVVDASFCTGCGACYKPCPVNAIQLNETAVAAVDKE